MVSIKWVKFQFLETLTSLLREPTPTPPGLIEVECREERDLMKKSKALKGDLEKLNTLVSKNKQLSVALEQENALMRTDYLQTLKARHGGFILLFASLFFLQIYGEQIIYESSHPSDGQDLRSTFLFFLCIQEQERQVIEMQMNLEKLQEEKERLLDVLMEAELVPNSFFTYMSMIEYRFNQQQLHCFIILNIS